MLIEIQQTVLNWNKYIQNVILGQECFAKPKNHGNTQALPAKLLFLKIKKIKFLK